VTYDKKLISASKQRLSVRLCANSLHLHKKKGFISDVQKTNNNANNSPTASNAP